jgi:hypothetical protein
MPKNVVSVSLMLTPVQKKKLEIIGAEMGGSSLSLIVRWAVDQYFKRDLSARRILEKYTESKRAKKGGKR